MQLRFHRFYPNVEMFISTSGGQSNVSKIGSHFQIFSVADYGLGELRVFLLVYTIYKSPFFKMSHISLDISIEELISPSHRHGN